MKNNLSRKFYTLLLGTGILLNGNMGCAGRRQVQAERYQMHDTFRLETDSLFMTRKDEQSEQRAYYWQEIQLSAPDSSGRQYIRSVKQAGSVARLTATRQDSLRQQSATVTTIRQENNVKQKKDNRRTFAGWAVMAAVVILIVIVVMRGRN